MGSSPEEAPEPPRAQKPSYSAIAKRAPYILSETTEPSTSPCKWKVFDKPTKLPPQVNAATVNHYGVLENQDLVELILSSLASSPWALVNLMRTSKIFYETGIKYLWRRADTRHLATCVKDDTRRDLYASLIRQVQFFDYEEMWPIHSIPCSKFPRVNSLELYGTSLRVSSSKMFMSFLGNTLRELKIWTEGESMEPPTRVQTDSDWLSYIGTTCTNLTTLKLEFTMEASSTELAAFFCAMPQLQVIRLGREMDSVLDRDAVTAVLTVPCLKDLSMEYELNLSFMNQFVGAMMPARILPSISTLKVNFADGNDLAATLLLDAIPTIEQLSMGLRSPAEVGVNTLHPALSVVMATLPKLSNLELQLSPTTRILYTSLSSITSHKKISHLSIFSGERDLQQLTPILLSSHELLHTPVNLRLLEIMEIMAEPSTVETTYDEATLIAHMVTEISPRHLELFDLVIDEVSSFGWPSTEDYNAPEPQNSVWKANGKSFAPDPTKWTSRDLNIYSNKDGEVLALDYVATDGNYNHLS